jgi:predicted dehydrogenase
MLANPDVDVVGIYTPDHLHADHIIRALEAGKHVIGTKPFIKHRIV